MLTFSPVIAFAATWLLLFFLLRHWAHLVLDQPNARSLHTAPTPRSGGLGMTLGVGLAWIWLAPPFSMLVLPLVILFLVSFMDDRFQLATRWRLLAHLLAAGVALWGLWPADLFWMWSLPLWLGLVWFSNLYNFMDGSDGLAGGMALFGFCAYALAAALAGDFVIAWAIGSIAAAALAFLLFNFHPARVFMGDAGSIPLGFLAGSLGFLGWVRQLWPWWFPLLVFSPFILDASVTLFRRLLRREKVWQAHREHYYQRMILMGLGHRNTALLEYACMLAVAASALWGMRQPLIWQTILLGTWLVIYGVLAVNIDRRWRAFQNASEN